jgi:hypothetical protein
MKIKTKKKKASLVLIVSHAESVNPKGYLDHQALTFPKVPSGNADA